MTTNTSAIYGGTVVHRRLRPRSHLLSYRVFSVLLDLDQLGALDRTTRLFGVNRWAPVSFHERDHGDGSGDLRTWVDQRLLDAGITPDGLRVCVLCYPRIWGYTFNPISVFFVETGDGSPVAMLYQVNNTKGERHTYVIPMTGTETPPYRQQCDKAMYVSPFTPMQGRYDFSVLPPGETVCVGIRQSDADGAMLNTSFIGAHRPFDGRHLTAALVRHPLMTIKVIVGIHWEAFRLWRKRIPVYSHTPQSGGDVSIVAAARRRKESDAA